MRSAVRRLIVKALPRLKEEHALWRHTVVRVAQLTDTTAQVEEATRRLGSAVARVDDGLAALRTEVAALAGAHDDRLDRLRRLVAQVEPYQPLYGVAGIVESPARTSVDRARRLEESMRPLPGQRVLDIGSSLGYLSYYLADRGAQVTGWDLSAGNVLVARAVGDLNGVPATFVTRELTEDTVGVIREGEFDSALLLAVLHHVIHFQGMGAAQRIVADLLDRIPVLYVELAVKGEDASLYWDAAQPEDPLEVFALVRHELDIEHLGMFGTHLSSVERPIYRVARRSRVRVAGHEYPYDRVSYEAYEGAPMAASTGRRRYYHADEYVIKEYEFTAEAPWNWQQIIGELHAYSVVGAHPEVHHALRLLDVDLSHERARLVVSRVEGQLLGSMGQVAPDVLVTVARDVLRTVADLRAIGLHHNDVRSWNIVVGPDGAWLIDYGLMGPAVVEDDVVALARALEAAATNRREGYATGLTELPDLAVFAGTPLEPFAAALTAGQRDIPALLALLA